MGGSIGYRHTNGIIQQLDGGITTLLFFENENFSIERNINTTRHRRGCCVGIIISFD